MKYKIFLSAVFVLVAACSSLRAEEGAASAVYYGNVDITGKEYIFDTGESGTTSCHCGLDPQSPVVFIAQNAKIYDKDGRLSNGSNSSLRGGQPALSVVEGKQSGIMSEKATPSPSVIFPVFPFSPSSSSFLQEGKESATISPHRQNNKPLPPVKTYRENTFRDINNSDLSLYHPKQRQKLSPSATQCGMLTSFISNPPPSRAPAHTAINA